MSWGVSFCLTLLTIWSCLMLEKVYARESSWSMVFKQDNVSYFKVQPNYMFEDSFVTVSVLCDTGAARIPLEISWILQRVDCVQELYLASINSTARLLEDLTRNSFNFRESTSDQLEENINRSHVIGSTYFQSGIYSGDPNTGNKYTCTTHNFIIVPDESTSPYYEALFYDTEPRAAYRRIDRKVTNDTKTQQVLHRVATVWEDGMYHFLMRIRALDKQDFTASVIVQMKGSYGLLSAIEWPLLPVTGGMSLLYLTAGTAWIFLWAKAQEHSQKIHIVIGAVAVAGALGNTLSFSDLSVRNSDGVGIYGIYWTGNFVTICQISLTLLLIMIVSTGYGINRPSLNSSHLQVMVIFSALIFASKLAFLIVSDETLKIKYALPSIFTLVSVIYLIVMLFVTGWIMAFSINTFIYLFQRRHSSESKLKVFCVFMACSISVFISHFVMVVVILSDRGFFKDCRQNWKQEWIASSFNHLLVLILLTVLMWLWRPMDELSSYAFQPLSTDEQPTMEEESADEKEKIMLEEL